MRHTPDIPAPGRLARLGRAVLAALLLLIGLPLLAPTPAAAAAAACGAPTFTVTKVSAPVVYLDLGTTPPLNSAY